MSSEIVVLGHFNEVEIQARPSDQYVNATAMCKATGKLWGDYWRLQVTQEFMDALSEQMGIPISDLVTSVKGQGTWVHRHVAIHLAQWLSPEFAVKASGWMDELLRTGRVSIVRERAEAWMQPYFEAQTEVLLGIADQIKALPVISSTLQEHGQRLNRLEAKIDAFVPSRKLLSSPTKQQHLETIGALGGMCPCCSRRKVVEGGEKLPDAEWDHWHAPHRSKASETWLVCRECNRSFNDLGERQKAERHFQSYQQRRIEREQQGGLPMFTDN